jgi:hypothetical protein
MPSEARSLPRKLRTIALAGSPPKITSSRETAASRACRSGSRVACRSAHRCRTRRCMAAAARLRQHPSRCRCASEHQSGLALLWTRPSAVRTTGPRWPAEAKVSAQRFTSSHKAPRSRSRSRTSGSGSCSVSSSCAPSVSHPEWLRRLLTLRTACGISRYQTSDPISASSKGGLFA